MNRVLSLAGLLFASALLSGMLCGQADHAAIPSASQPAPQANLPSPDSLRTNGATWNPCALFPAYSERKLLGPIDREWLAKSMSDTTPVSPNAGASTHWACMLQPTPRPGVPTGSIIAFELIIDGAISFETGAREMNRAARNMLDLVGAKTADGAQHGVDGWDYLGAYPREMTGRTGHVAIHVDWEGVAVSLDSLEKLMTMMRDQIPDRPFDAFGPGSEAGEEDPCSLVTRDEAESILGKLSAPPYESRDLSGLADKNGTGCSFYTKNHHVLSIRPWWSHGTAVFNVIGATLPMPIAGVEPGPDTWDKQGADPVGNLYFLKGDRLLAVSWQTSSVTGDGAVGIARIAMKKLEK